MAHPPALPSPASRPSSQTPEMHLDAELDDNSFNLTPEQASRADRFREELRACETDSERYDLCAEKRDELLDRHAGLQLLVSSYERIMSIECPTYRQRKQTRGRGSGNEGDVEQWRRFIGLAEEGDGIKSACLSALKEVARCWGQQVIQHYRWASRGEKYCNQLRAAARKVPRWDDAVTGLNWSILERSRNVRRRPVKASANPIEQHDLQHLKTWPQDPSLQKKFSMEDIPNGLGLDAFGLLVHKEIAAALPQVDTAGASASREDHLDTSAQFPTSEESNQTALDPVVSEVIETFLAEYPSGAARSTRKESNHTALEPALLAECAGDTSGGQLVADAPHAPHIPGCAEAAADPSIASETIDREDSDTDGAEDRQDSPAIAVPDRPPRMALRPHMPPSFKGLTGSSRTKPRTANLRETHPSAKEVPEMPPDCCPELPPLLRSTLANPFLFSRETADRFFPFLRQLCHKHLQRYVDLRYRTEQEHAVSLANSARLAEHPDTSNRRRRASLPDITPSKRSRLGTPEFSRRPGASEDRPAHDHVLNDAYKQRAMADLKQNTPVRGSHGAETNQLVLELLEKAEHPNTESSHGKVEALFCTGDEAARIVEARFVGDALIITKDQQPFEWGKNGRPIEQFFRRFCIFDTSVSVQVPSRPSTKQSFEVHIFGEVKKRFLQEKNTTDPWNVLDLQSPVQSILPKFLTGENCGLLLDVRNRVLMEGSAERVTAPLQKWTEWKDVDKFALLSQGGHHTTSHMDSHGYPTWITVQEGQIGFGWLSCPTKEEREAWMAEPHKYTGGRWRYIILKPGQTVFFPSGTIHFVFRVRDHQTLALGGHVLQWSGIQRWIQVVLWELKNPATTNEEMNTTAPKLVRMVAKLVSAKVDDGRIEELGGVNAVKRFFDFVEVRMASDYKRALLRMF